MRRVLLCVGLTLCATAFSAAQAPPPTLRGNPTPGTAQPEPPKPADRIALSGCVVRVAIVPITCGLIGRLALTTQFSKKRTRVASTMRAAMKPRTA